MKVTAPVVPTPESTSETPVSRAVEPVASINPSASSTAPVQSAPVNLFQAAATATAGKSTNLSPGDVDPVFAQRLLQQMTGWNTLRARANLAAAERSVPSPSRAAPLFDTRLLEEIYHVQLQARCISF